MTIAQQLNIKEFPFEIKDSNGNVIYYEDKDKYWEIKEFDSKRNVTHFEDSTGYWAIKEYNSKGIVTRFDYSYGNNKYNRPKIIELTLDEIAEKFNIPVKNLKIKK